MPDLPIADGPGDVFTTAVLRPREPLPPPPSTGQKDPEDKRRFSSFVIGQRVDLSRQWIISVVLLSLLTILAGVFFRPVFEAWSYLIPPLVAAIVVATLVALAADRWGLSASEATLVHFIVGVLVLPGFLGLSKATFGLPTPGALAQIIGAIIRGPARLLTSPVPARSGQELLAAPVGSAWVGFVVGWVLMRKKRGHLSLLGPVVTLAMGLAFGPVGGQFLAVVAGLFLLAALGFLTLVTRLRDEQTQRVVLVGTKRSSPVSAVAILAVVAVAASALAPNLPGLSSRRRFTFRQWRTPPFDPSQLPSPLANYAKYLTPAAQKKLLFTATGELPARWDLAVLTSYDGRTWSVGEPNARGGGEFALIGARLARLSDYAGAKRASTTVTLEGLNEPWLPTPGPGLELSAPATALGDEVRTNARFNPLSGTLVTPSPSATKTQYSLAWAKLPKLDRNTLPGKLLSPGGIADLPRSDSINAVAKRADELLGAGGETSANTWDQVEKLRARLAGEGYLSNAVGPGHAAGNLRQMISAPENLIGNAEHFNALLGVMGRAKGWPMRVVVGFIPQQPLPGSKVQQVYGRDVRVWNEVAVDGVGWVPMDITLDPSRRPQPQPARQLSASDKPPVSPVTTPSPEPEPPVIQPAKEKPKEKPLSRQSRLLLTIVKVAGTVMAPFVFIALVIASIVALKWRRRTKRRQRPQLSESIAGAWEEVLDRVVEAGHPAARSQTIRELSIGMQESFPAAIEPLEILAALGERAAFHPSSPTEADRSEAWGCVDEVSSCLRIGTTRLQHLRRLASPRSLRKTFLF